MPEGTRQSKKLIVNSLGGQNHWVPGGSLAWRVSSRLSWDFRPNPTSGTPSDRRGRPPAVFRPGFLGIFGRIRSLGPQIAGAGPPQFFGKVLQGFSAESDPEDPLRSQGPAPPINVHEISPRRPTPMPCRDEQRLPPNCFQVPSLVVRCLFFFGKPRSRRLAGIPITQTGRGRLQNDQMQNNA